MATLLELRNVTKSFGAVRALRGVSFALEEGEVHALLGENGAGKSTLIKVITGAYALDDGEIQIGGQSVSHLTPARARALGIACIYQQPALFPDLSVAENIALRLEKTSPLHTVGWAARRTRARELLHRIGAEIDPAAEVRTLSMPEQQLVEIACALGAGAHVVIMDEPTASLTQKEQHLLFAVVRDLRAHGVGVIYISHRLEEIFALADRVTVLRDGESVGTNPVDEINESALIKMMVGREVTAIYPPAQSAPGASRLTLKKVGCSQSGVHGIDLELRAGEIVGMAGLVGAGRTELARILFGLTPADTGEIQLGGQAVQITDPRSAIAHGIAYVPEDRRRHGVILEMPIAANTTMAIHAQIFPGTWLRSTAERQLTLDFIRDLGVKTAGPQAPGGSLSGGNQQKIALARWLATKPKVLILDEPTQGVDVGAKSEIYKIIRHLAAEGLAVLMISSDLPEVLGMSDRVLVMRGGTIVAEFPHGVDAHDVMAAALGQKKEAA
ncbi:ABC transporter-related protein [Chthoniobacter flavus Ellin428]|uniref:ABC transporter-related protein n=1 Tax=Chthoniobacter flavus Ellin428 TaxID=497964 RepID=B4D2C6_9BACT|nr:sugar ABC transporter ATP-binding protein [Chthoniobacter flavus]EDY19366.1 ABC transporter-related protein [Chthoniobacter flavus Ellin428]TCO90505.1 monosaccharide ABC transporter ATP-binding protein (CUT2 family) [Chthoniobacter flavus]